MKLKPVLLAVLACVTTCNSISTTMAAVYGQGESFYQEKEKGWFWYEPEPEPEADPEQTPEPDIKISPPTAPEKPESTEKPKNVEINVKWLRDNLPRLRDTAIDYPSEVNVKRYLYAQRLMLDKASKFSAVSMEVSALDPTLNEELRRPGHQNALLQYGDERRKASDKLLKLIAQKAGLFFFFKSTCQFCHQQAPILFNIQEQSGMQILPISVDGKMIPNSPWGNYYVTDTSGTLGQKLHVKVYPTIYIVTKDGKEMHNIAAGLTSYDELVKRIFVVAKQQKWISEVEYQQIKHVREIQLVKDPSKPITLDENKIYNDPSYLSEQLRQQFEARYSGKARGELAFGGE